MKNTKIISAFPGCGKTQCYKNNKSLTILDSDSSMFSRIESGNGIIRNSQFPNNYIAHIQENIGKVDIIFISSHEVVRDAMKNEGIEYTLIYPDIELKDEYINRYINRGNDSAFIDIISNNWETWIHDIESEDYPKLIKLSKGMYINDIYQDLIKY